MERERYDALVREAKGDPDTGRLGWLRDGRRADADETDETEEVRAYDENDASVVADSDSDSSESASDENAKVAKVSLTSEEWTLEAAREMAARALREGRGGRVDDERRGAEPDSRESRTARFHSFAHSVVCGVHDSSSRTFRSGSPRNRVGGGLPRPRDASSALATAPASRPVTCLTRAARGVGRVVRPCVTAGRGSGVHETPPWARTGCRDRMCGCRPQAVRHPEPGDEPLRDDSGRPVRRDAHHRVARARVHPPGRVLRAAPPARAALPRVPRAPGGGRWFRGYEWAWPVPMAPPSARRTRSSLSATSGAART